jgi:hypothetical protein
MATFQHELEEATHGVPYTVSRDARCKVQEKPAMVYYLKYLLTTCDIASSTLGLYR